MKSNPALWIIIFYLYISRLLICKLDYLLLYKSFASSIQWIKLVRRVYAEKRSAHNWNNGPGEIEKKFHWVKMMGELVLNEVEAKEFFIIKMLYSRPYFQYSNIPFFHFDGINRLPLIKLYFQ